MTFTVGEKVVYPNHGVGTIENITTRSSGAHLERFYLLRLSSNSMTVMVPFSHVDDVGLRKVTKNGEIAKVLAFLSTGVSQCSHDWKNRFKENSAKMQGGSLLEIAEVLKQLVILQSDKPLSFREKKMLDRARQMLVGEVCACRALGEFEAVELLQRSLSKSNLKWPEPL
jgi:CarD family transcriptional regulator